MKLRILHNLDGSQNRCWWCVGCNEYHQDNGEWEFNNNNEYPTFKPSFLFRDQNGICHSIIVRGMVHYLDDCTHEYAARAVPLREEQDD